MLLARATLDVGPLVGTSRNCDAAAALGIGEDWVLARLRVKGMTILIGAAYLLTGVGLEGENLERLMRINTLRSALGWPMLVGGDFNLTPEEIHPILQTLEAEVKTPAGVEATCTSGRMLDYYLVSPELIGAVRATSVAPDTHGERTQECNWNCYEPPESSSAGESEPRSALRNCPSASWPTEG